RVPQPASCSWIGSMSPRYQARTRGPMNVSPVSGSPPGSTWTRARPRRASTIVAPMTSTATAAVPGRHSTGIVVFLPAQLAAQEALDRVARPIVRNLLGWVLHQMGRPAQQRTADASITRHATAADGVDHASRRVGAVLHREPELDLDGRVPEAASLHAEEADLVVALPGHVVAG